MTKTAKKPHTPDLLQFLKEITMHQVMTLVVLFSVLLIGVSFTQSSFAANHQFDLEFGISGIGKPGMFLEPQHMAIDSENNIYVTDLGNARVQKFDNQGNYITSWGSKGSESGQFSSPSGIVVGNESVFVVDNKLNRVQEFDLEGNFVNSWGSIGSKDGNFKSPNGIFISNDKFIYIVDTGNNRIQKFTLDGEFVSSFGQSGQRGGHFVSAKDIAINNDGDIFVTDNGNHRINIYDSNGNFKTTFNSSVGGLAISPEGIVFDEQNNFYIVDQKNNRIVQFNNVGITLSIFGVMGWDEGQFMFPTDVMIDNDGFLYVTDTLSNRVQKFITPYAVEKQNETIEQEKLQTETTALNTADEEIFENKQINPVPRDFVKPEIIVPKDITIEAVGSLTFVDLGNAVANDESGIYSLSNNAPESFPIGITTVIWTAVDGAGNMAIASQTVTVQDTTPAEIEQLSEILLEAKSENQNLVQLKTPSVSDSIGIISLENNAPETFPLGETVVTWTAIDVMENISTMQQKIILIDSTIPRIDIPEDIIVEAVSLDMNNISLIEPQVLDDVKIESLTNDAPEFFPLGETIVTWTVSDSSGNIATSSHSVTVVDTVAPEIFVNDVILEATESNGSDQVLTVPEISDLQQVSISNDAPNLFPFGETVVTWTAIDKSGNISTQTQLISVVDTITPVLILPDNIEVEANGINTVIENLGELIVEDISGISSISNNAPGSFPLGETVVTWTAIDNYENVVSNTQLITVIDTTAPEIVAPSDIRVEAIDPFENHIDLVGVRVSDAVDIKSVSNDAPNIFPLGTTIVTWVATDISGNVASDRQNVIVEDTIPPSIIVPNDMTLEILDKDGMTVEIGQANVTDQVDNNPEISNDAPEIFNLGDTIVTWEAIDVSGNLATVYQTISIIDSTPPEIIAPDNIIQEAQNEFSNSVNLNALDVKTSDIVGVISIENDAPEFFPLGETIVTWAAIDASGNFATASQLVSIIDTSKPSIQVPESVTIEATSYHENIVGLDNAFATDTIGISTITNDAPEFFPLGATTVTWTATDASGNFITDVQQVTIIDSTPPIIITPEDIIVSATSLSSTNVDLNPPTANDLVSDIRIDNDSPGVFPFGETIVTWSATDESGNISHIKQLVNVIDDSPPELQTPEDIVIDASSLENIIDIGVPLALDMIDSQPIISNDAPEFFPLGATTVTWTATDASGNSVTSSQLVDIQACGNSISYYNMILGTEEGDVLSGTTLPDLIFAKGGDDFIIGDKGNDCIFGGEGDDIIFGNEGNDNITGGQGSDVIKGQSGEDVLKGGAGLDMIDGGDDIDVYVTVEEQNNDLVIKCEANE